MTSLDSTASEVLKYATEIHELDGKASIECRKHHDLEDYADGLGWEMYANGSNLNRLKKILLKRHKRRTSKLFAKNLAKISDKGVKRQKKCGKIVGEKLSLQFVRKKLRKMLLSVVKKDVKECSKAWDEAEQDLLYAQEKFEAACLATALGE